jgi:flagellar biogenesis protein FliO
MDGRRYFGLSGVHAGAGLRGWKMAMAVIAVAVLFLQGVVRAEGVADEPTGTTDSAIVDAPVETSHALTVESHVQGPALPKVLAKNGAPKVEATAAPLDGPVAVTEIEDAPIRGRSHVAEETKETKGADKTASGGSSFAVPSGVMNALQVAAALTVVVGLIFIGKALAKKFVPGAKAGNGKGVIEVLARYPLAKNQSLVLVRIGSQIVTLNQGKESSQSVLVISDANEVAKILGQVTGESPNSIQAGFNKLLANARMDLSDPANEPEREDFEMRSMEPENLDDQLEEMASAKRQLMELRQQVRSVRDAFPRT